MKTIEKKEPYLHILNTRGNVYEEFLPDQVLTHKNLNKVVDYFEDQDRLSRIYLSGVGIGCGINIVSYGNNHIEIGQGVGITTDGDLVKTETRRFQYYSELRDKADYALFKGTQVYEIYEQEGAGRQTGELPLTSFTTNESISLKDCIVIAYVENYTEDEGLCGGSGCDETGNKVYSNLKFLITHKSNYAKLISGDTIYKSHDVLSYYDILPDICIPRLLLTKDNTKSGIGIHDQFKAAFFLKDALFNGISTIITNFSHRINFAKFNITIPQIATYFDTLFNVKQEEFIQYKYDLLKDLVSTYTEIRNLILHTAFECVPTVNAFPKHLLLGTLEETSRLQTRHRFYPSPIVSTNDENLMSIRTLSIKFFNQLKEYKIQNPRTTTIKITPSKGYHEALSKRSIPYYYETKRSLVENWNPKSIENRKSTYQLGYHVKNLRNIPCIQKPLEYCHLDKDFYRIEGHLGKNFGLALGKINGLKAKYNLSFDVKAVSIGFPVSKVRLDDDTCETKDYSILLKTWEKEFCCTASNAIDFFNKYQFISLGDNETQTAVYTGNNRILTHMVANNDAARTIEISNRNTKAAAAARYEDTLAYSIEQAYVYLGNQNSSAVSVATIALGIIDETIGPVDKGEDFFLYVTNPIKLITDLEAIKRLFITTLNDIYVTEKWTAFNTAIDQLCADVQQALFALSQLSENSRFGSKIHDKMYEYFLYELSKLCCIKEQFTWLKTQVDEIRYDVYKKLILSQLVEKHPGLEHMAGVPKGGTFLMVYLGATEESIDGEQIVRSFNGQVLFDFALPYMCCSDCPPETIVYNVIPEIEENLSISRKKYCLPSQDQQVEFSVEPQGGVVTSPEGEAFIVQTTDGYAFDPGLVPDSLLGQPITFLVNGKVPKDNLEVCVFRLPEDNTVNYEVVEWRDEGLVVNLTLSHEFESQSYLSYSWKRANDSEIDTTKDVTEVLFATKDNVINETISVQISAADHSESCIIEVPITIRETRPEEPIDVQIKEIICCEVDETSPSVEAILITPTNGILTSPQEPANGPSFIQQIQGQYVFNPLHVPASLIGQPITFMVNNRPVENVTTTVYKIPSVVNLSYRVVNWNDNGLEVNLLGSHALQDQTYFTYQWLDQDKNILGTNRNLLGFEIDAPDGIVNNTYGLRITIAGVTQIDCRIPMTPIPVEENRPETIVTIRGEFCCVEGETLEIVPITVSPEGLELRCPQAEETGADFFKGEPDNYEFDPNEVPEALWGQPITFEIDGVEEAQTIVFKIPAEASAIYRQPNWEGNTLTVDFIGNQSIDAAESYLKYTWLNANNEEIGTGKNLEHSIVTANGTINETFNLRVGVNNELTSNPCNTPLTPVTVEEARPIPTITIDAEFCCIETPSDVTTPPDISVAIAVTPPGTIISSPEGTAYILGTPDNYRFDPAAVPENLLGEPIRFVIDGVERARTKVYKLPNPQDIAISQSNHTWNDNGLLVQLTSNLTNRSYYNLNWFSRNNGVDTEINSTENLNEYLIPDSGDGVRTQVFLRISADESQCSPPESPTIIVRRNRPVALPKTAFCAPESAVVFSGTRTDIAEVRCTNPGISTNVVTSNSSNQYVFNPTNVRQNFYGETLRFSVGNVTQSDLTAVVYRLPNMSTVRMNTENSEWGANGYEFSFTHNLYDKNYFNYNLTRKSDGRKLQKLPNDRYLIPETSAVNDHIDIQITINGVDCSDTASVPVDVINGDQQGRMDCTNTFTGRMNILGVPTSIGAITNSFKEQSFEQDIRGRILVPLGQTIQQIENASSLDSVVAQVLGKVNEFRTILISDYIQNDSLKNFEESFIKLDEAMELITLETLRCIVENNANLDGMIDQFFETSSGMNNVAYQEKTREKINGTYETGYVPNLTSITSRFTSVFNSNKP